MSGYNNGINGFNAVMAFQGFAGKSLRAIDAVAALTESELAGLRSALVKIAAHLRTENADDFADLHRLAEHIERWTGPANWRE